MLNFPRAGGDMCQTTHLPSVWRKIALVVILPLILDGCNGRSSPSPQIGDGGLLSRTPCAPPCFQGIEPGTTTLSEAKSLLTDALLCDKPADFDTEFSGGSRGFKCGEWLTVSAVTGREDIAAVGFSTESPLDLEAVIGQLGPPDAILVAPVGLPERPHVTVLVFHDLLRARLLLVEQEGASYQLRPDIVLERVVYASPSTYASLRAGAIPWSGYGQYPTPR